MHVFLPTTGPDRELAYRWLLRTWRRCAEVAGMTEAVAALSPLPAAPPAHQRDLPAASRPIAACTRPGDGVHQALLRREHDLLCLSIVLAPRPPTAWADLERLWERLAGGEHAPATAVGQARLFLAAGHDAGPPDAVATRTGFRMWEAPSADDGRPVRRLFAVAPPGRSVRLSAWVWTDGSPVLAPLTRYLMAMATIRQQLRLWSHAGGLRAARDRADALLDQLVPALDDDDPVAAATAEETSLAWERHLASLRSAEAALVTAATDLRRVRRTVRIAAANGEQAIRPEMAAGAARPEPIRADHALSGWFVHQLDDDGEYLEATRERISSLTPLIEHAVAHRWQERRERIALAQAAVVGALVVVLTAAQALSFDVPLPNTAKSGLVLAAGAAVLWLSLLVLRPAVPAHRGRITRFAHAAVAAAATGVAWTVNTTLAPGRGPVWAVAPPVATFAVAWVTATISDRLRRRPRRGKEHTPS